MVDGVTTQQSMENLDKLAHTTHLAIFPGNSEGVEIHGLTTAQPHNEATLAELVQSGRALSEEGRVDAVRVGDGRAQSDFFGVSGHGGHHRPGIHRFGLIQKGQMIRKPQSVVPNRSHRTESRI